MTDEQAAKLLHDVLWAGERYLLAFIDQALAGPDRRPGFLDKPRQNLITAVEALAKAEKG